MSPIRIRATAQADGELYLRGLPIRKGQAAEVVVVTEDGPDDMVLAVLEHDQAWAWLRDPSEDIYSEEDAQ